MIRRRDITVLALAAAARELLLVAIVATGLTGCATPPPSAAANEANQRLDSSTAKIDAAQGRLNTIEDAARKIR